ncbi:MAG TPA: GntR family transcriptional regulator, partial [bacterium]
MSESGRFAQLGQGGAQISQDTVRPIREDLEPIRRTKVYAEVASQIHRLIVAGRLKPGDRLPPERELA